jgi:hypothetical protein
MTTIKIADKPTLDTVNENTSRLTSTRAGYIDRIANSTYGLDKIKSLIDTIKTTIDNISTNVSNLNSRLTSTRAGYLDYLANSTYGLSAIKTAINNVNTAVSNNGGLKSVTKTYSTLSTSGTASGLTLEQRAGLYSVCVVSGDITVNTNFKYRYNNAIMPAIDSSVKITANEKVNTSDSPLYAYITLNRANGLITPYSGAVISSTLTITFYYL